jgi:putative ABC transport system substrate-binding protein
MRDTIGAAIAAELVKAAPEAILCGGDAAIRAAQAATSTIPIVAITDDMVGAGLVRSLARPGGNTSGVSILAADLDGKRQGVDRIHPRCSASRRALRRAKQYSGTASGALLDAARAHGIELTIHRVERRFRPERERPLSLDDRSRQADG